LVERLGLQEFCADGDEALALARRLLGLMGAPIQRARFHGIRASSRPMPHRSVMPAEASPRRPMR
jgi:hypothetical protein